MAPTAYFRRARMAGAAGLVLYVGILGVVAFWPTPVDRDARPTIDAVLEVVPAVSYQTLERMANIVLYVPLGAFAAILVAATAESLVLIPLGALFVSSFAETVQNDFLIHRFGSVGDILANTTGAILGTVVGLTLIARVRNAASRRAPDASRRRRGRVRLPHHVDSTLGARRLPAGPRT